MGTSADQMTPAMRLGMQYGLPVVLFIASSQFGAVRFYYYLIIFLNSGSLCILVCLKHDVIGLLWSVQNTSCEKVILFNLNKNGEYSDYLEFLQL